MSETNSSRLRYLIMRKTVGICIFTRCLISWPDPRASRIQTYILEIDQQCELQQSLDATRALTFQQDVLCCSSSARGAGIASALSPGKTPLLGQPCCLSRGEMWRHR